MATQLIAPTFPFSPDDYHAAIAFRDMLLCFRENYGPAMKDWDVPLSDNNFLKALATQWVVVFGREPTPAETPVKMVTDLLEVTDEQFAARMQSGAMPR